MLPEIKNVFDQRPGIFLKKNRIAGVKKMLPEMSGEPGTTGPVQAPAAASPHDIVGAVGDPSPGGFNHGIGSRFLYPRHVQYPVEQRLMHLRQIGNFCQPVVHLDVDVGGVLRVPRRTAHIVP